MYVRSMYVQYITTYIHISELISEILLSSDYDRSTNYSLLPHIHTEYLLLYCTVIK